MFLLLDTLGYVPTSGYSRICSYYMDLGYVPTTGYFMIGSYYRILKDMFLLLETYRICSYYRIL